jgi:hypothetical protein
MRLNNVLLIILLGLMILLSGCNSSSENSMPDPKKLIPDSCTFSGFECVESQVYDSTIEITLQNLQNQAIVITSISSDSCTSSDSIESFKPEDDFTFSLTCEDIVPGEKFKKTVMIEYYPEASGSMFKRSAYGDVVMSS